MCRARIRLIVFCLTAAVVGLLIGTLLSFGVRDVVELARASSLMFGE